MHARAGQCESTESCKWEAPVQGQPRGAKYTAEDAKKAEVGMCVCACMCAREAPCVSRPYVHTHAHTQATIKAYITSLGMVLAPGLILGILNFIVMFFVIICRCCCKNCGVRPREDGYTTCQRFTPLGFFVVS
jgi:hypothetical protein